MTQYLIKRVLGGVLVVGLVSVIVFFVPRLAGDPIQTMLPLGAPPEQRDALRSSLGWDRPLLAQFGDFAAGVVQLDFGDSIWQRRPAIEVIAERVPATLELAATALLLTLIVAIPLGIFAATRPNSALDRVLTNLSLIGFSVPLFLVGLLLIMVFGVVLGWLPTSGRAGLQHLILPALTLALNGIASLAMITRSAVIDALNQPWIKTARLKGLPFRRTVGIHALKSSATTIVTAIGLDVISLLATGLIIVESVFAWPGLGSTAVDAIQRNDLVLLQAVIFCIATAIVVVNILVDLAYKLFDPRIDYSHKAVKA